MGHEDTRKGQKVVKRKSEKQAIRRGTSETREGHCLLLAMVHLREKEQQYPLACQYASDSVYTHVRTDRPDGLWNLNSTSTPVGRTNLSLPVY